MWLFSFSLPYFAVDSCVSSRTKALQNKRGAVFIGFKQRMKKPNQDHINMPFEQFSWGLVTRFPPYPQLLETKACIHLAWVCQQKDLCDSCRRKNGVESWKLCSRWRLQLHCHWLQMGKQTRFFLSRETNFTLRSIAYRGWSYGRWGPWI